MGIDMIPTMPGGLDKVPILWYVKSAAIPRCLSHHKAAGIYLLSGLWLFTNLTEPEVCPFGLALC